jgi:small GTP-binding protein
MKNPFKKKPVEKDELVIFREQVEKGLKKLPREEVVRFAWRCAVRALPFLGAKGNFDFWKENDRQKHLQSIFYAVDTAADTAAADPVAFADVAFAFADAAFADAADAFAAAAFAATRAADAAADADASAYAVGYAAAYASASEDTSARAAAVRAAAVAAARAAAAARIVGIDYSIFIQMTLDELQYGVVSREGGHWPESYRFVMERFSEALKSIGCSYWAEWYKKIFENGFELDEEDKKEIKMRVNVPTEIQDRGAAEVVKYIQNLKQGTAERLNEARILILGDKGAGKTCLARRLNDLNAEMTSDEESTPGVDATVWKLKKENVNVHIWDFAGHTVTHAVHQFFLSERCLYILVFDGRTEGNGRWEYWLDHMKNYGKDSKAIILVNKRDVHAVQVPINKLKEQYPILDICTFSIRDDRAKLEEFRQMVANYITNNPSWSNQLIPESSYKVKIELEKLFTNGNQNGKELIERKDFDAIADKCKVEKDKVDGLLSDLHALGISLWYKDMEKYNTMVLNPEWISNGVYRIINWANNQRKHCLKIGEFTLVFEKESTRYPEKQHRFLFELMKKYELAYEAKEKDVLIIPRLLYEDQPANLPAFHLGESLMARYKADQPLMPDTISRFIVRHNEEIKKEGENNYLVWRSGVILEQPNGATALVRETNDRTIEVSIKGANKTEYLSRLRETLNAIFEGYKSKKPELQYQVEAPKEIEVWLPDRKILAHAQNNIPYFEENTGSQIVLNQTVNIYNITAQTLISGRDNQYWDQSIHNTFNFKDCNINLQGSLNDLARQLTKAGNTEEAVELKDAIDLLAETENCKTPEEVKKKGILRGLQQFAEKLGDEESSLCKTIKGIEKGIGVAQDIAKGYNSIAQWVGLPQVPNVFLKK